MRILIVEDERRLADTLMDMITQHNHLADACYDGESGLDNAMSGIYDAVILDVMCPSSATLRWWNRCVKTVYTRQF